jgi:hypothetical protein
MGNKRTIKALEELVKTEHMAVAALDSALEEIEDNKLRKQYRKWRDSHMKQGEALNDRLEDLGGEPLEYEVGSGKGQASLWGKLTGLKDDFSLAGMRLGAERGIKRYIDHLDEIDDPKSLSIIRKNLEAKQDEIEWYDEQANKERTHKVETKLAVTEDKTDKVLAASDGKKGGGIPFPLLIIAGAIGAVAFFFLRKGEEADYDDYGEDAFRYESEGEGESASGGYGASTSFNSQGNGASTDYNSNMSSSSDVSSAS